MVTKKKLFALASVTALTGLMAAVAASGCSSTTVAAGSDPNTATPEAGGKTDAKKPDAGDVPAEDSAPGACGGTLAVDPTVLTWKSPTKTVGACSAADLDALVTYVENNSSAQYSAWKGSVTKKACSACIFGLESATAWAPLLEDAKGQLVGLNVGGCIAIASGNDKCGKAYQNWFDCGFEACTDCPSGDSAALSKCRSASNKAGGGCKSYFDAVTTVCTDAVVSDAETACTGAKYVFEGPIKAQCIDGLAGEGG
jgi:hypothetical protein